MANNPLFNLKTYYGNIARTFRAGKSVPHRIANKTAGPGEYVGAPVGTAAAFLKNSTNSFANYMTTYGNASRLSRYADYQTMESMAEIASALDIYAHETVSKDEYGNIVKVESSDPNIKKAIEHLLDDVLNLEFNAVPWVRTLCKYGDLCLLVDHHPDFGVVNLFPMPINEIEREEGFDLNNPTRYQYRWETHGKKAIEPWQVLHFRLLGNDAYLPYGMSVLEPCRRPWRQLLLLEDAVMVYRIVRSPERRVFYIDVGNIAPNDVPNIMEKAKNQLKRNQIVDPSSGQVDLRYNALPVHWSTPVPLLDGRVVTIKQLAQEYQTGKENWVYSFQDQSKKMVPGRVVWCGKNYTAKKLVKVTTEDGNYALTAPEHPFMMRDGTSKRADELQHNDRLMPLSRWVDSKNYESCYDPFSKRYLRTHQIVARDVFEHELETVPDPVVHHVQHWKGPINKRNNSPDNLLLMEREAHSLLHRLHASSVLNTPELLEKSRQRFIVYNHTEEHRQRTIENNKKFKKAQKMGEAYNGSSLHMKHNKIRKQAQLKSWADPEQKNHRSQRMRWSFPESAHALAQEIYQQNPSLKRDDFIEAFRTSPAVAAVMEPINSHSKRKLSKLSKPSMMQWLQEKGYSGFDDLKEKSLASEHYTNHRVEKVEIIDADDDVYCMTVLGKKGEKDRHNFAIRLFSKSGQTSDSSCFVKNSVDEDFFLPVRGQETGTRIETLPGGAYTGDVQDLDYIQNKLFAALKIPKSYLGYQESTGKATLSQEDVRFARTIQHIQRVFLAELEKVAMIQLYSMGYRDEELCNFELSMANPSTINEIQRLELWRTRFEVASLATGQDGVLDKHFIYEHILHMNDHEIEQVERGRFQDAEMNAALEAVENPQPEQPDEPQEPEQEDEQEVEDDDDDEGNPLNRGRDPNVQRAAPNAMLGKAAKSKQTAASPLNQVFNLKKNGMDPERPLQSTRRAATAPFGENKKDPIFEKRVGLLGKYSGLIKSLEDSHIGQKGKKVL